MDKFSVYLSLFIRLNDLKAQYLLKNVPKAVSFEYKSMTVS